MVPSGAHDPRVTDVGRFVVRCPDRPGIVAVPSRLLADVGANVTDSQQHSSDQLGDTFTLRLEFVPADVVAHGQHLEGALSLLARQEGITRRLTEAGHRPTIAVFVSRTDHALQELIDRVRAGDLRAELRLGTATIRDPDHEASSLTSGAEGGRLTIRSPDPGGLLTDRDRSLP